MTFIDEAVIMAVAGDGGNGCIAFRREKFVPKGGPSGGDGGLGGSVYLVGDRNLNTLYHLRHRPRLAAQRGRHGEGSNKTGRSGEDLEIRAPLGTECWDTADDTLVGEILEEGERLLVAKGGIGGRGNARFSKPSLRAPRYAEDGREGENRTLRLELKLLADVGFVGLPNAGKSTLMSAISAARPKIASYPFTTLVPQLGVVATGPLSEPFVIADLPGLIEGAAEGAGLGLQFLRHVERCRVLVHLVDLSAHNLASLQVESPGEGALSDESGLAPPADLAGGGGEGDGGDASESDPATAVVQELEAVEEELEAFDASLLQRGRLIVGSKKDAASEERRAALRSAADQRGLSYVEISSVTRNGLDSLIAAISDLLRQAKAEERALEEESRKQAAQVAVPRSALRSMSEADPDASPSGTNPSDATPAEDEGLPVGDELPRPSDDADP